MSHENTLTHREEGDAFQPTMKDENKEYLEYDDGQELKETKGDINHSDVILGETEKKVIEDFLNLVADLGQQEDLMIESSNKTIESCGFKTDKLNVFAGIVEDNQSYGIVLSEAESVRH